MSFYFVLVATVLVGLAAAAHSSEASSGLREQSRAKRQVFDALGAQELQDRNDPKYKRLAREAYDKYHEEHLDGYMVMDISLTRVTRQLVAGYLYRLLYRVDRDDHTGYRDDQFCKSHVYEKPDHQMEFTTHCYPIEKQRRGKRQLLPGGEETRDTNDPEYKELAEESYKKYLETDNSPPPKMAKEISVTRATYQVVSGSVKRIDFVVTTIYEQVLECHSEVWEQPWLDRKDIDVNCKLLA